MANEKDTRPVTTTATSAPRPMAEIKPGHLAYHEPFASEGYHTSFFDWRAVFAGTVLAFLAYGIFMALGLAVGGANLQGTIQGAEVPKGLRLGFAIWTTAAMIFSVFIGAYVAGRIGVRKFVEARLGWIHGAVVAALFFIVAFFQIAALTGALARGMGSTVSFAATAFLENGEVQDAVQVSLGDLDFRSPEDEVAKGVAVRLIRGDGSAAANYLAYQAGISVFEAEARLASIRNEVQSSIRESALETSRGLKIFGWTLFAATLLGALVAMWGGTIGARIQIQASERTRMATPTTYAGRA